MIDRDPRCVPRDLIRRMYMQVLKGTPTLKDSRETWIGFMVGFRAYERFQLEMLDYYGIDPFPVARDMEATLKAKEGA